MEKSQLIAGKYTLKGTQATPSLIDYTNGLPRENVASSILMNCYNMHQSRQLLMERLQLRAEKYTLKCTQATHSLIDYTNGPPRENIASSIPNELL